MKYTVKLAKRAALRKLNEEDCNVIIEKASSKFVFKTKAGIFTYEGVDSVHIPNERMIVPVTDITKIEMPISRFTPDITSMMEVDWQ